MTIPTRTGIIISNEELLSKAIYIIENNISNPDLNADLVCKELGISKGVLHMKLKCLTGKNINEFMRVIRLQKSKDLVLEGELNIVEISLRLGFNNPYFFSRSFAQYFGLAPFDYKRYYQIGQV